MGDLLRAGADKVGMNSSAVRNPALITEGAELFGSQCIVASVDAAREGPSWRAYTHGGRTPTNLDGVEWARECARLGAGEIGAHAEILDQATVANLNRIFEGLGLEVAAVHLPEKLHFGHDIDGVGSRDRAARDQLRGQELTRGCGGSCPA